MSGLGEDLQKRVDLDPLKDAADGIRVISCKGFSLTLGVRFDTIRLPA